MTDLDALACPRCLAALEERPGGLACTACLAPYGSEGGIPDLLPWAGGAPGPEWDRWRGKLEALREWRRGTWDGSSSARARQEVADVLAEDFFRFARIPEGARVLEIGCGAGDLLRYLPGRRYLGVDPMPLRGEVQARLVRGVGEKLPVATGAFEAVLVCETMDHALDPVRVLRESRRVLAPGGILALMQSVRVPLPAPPPAVRLRAAAGRLKARLRGERLPVSAEGTKMHVFGPEELESTVAAELLVEAAVTRGQTLFLRARRGEGGG